MIELGKNRENFTMKHAKMEFIVSEWDNKPYLIDLEAREIAHPEYFAEPPFLAEYSFTDEAGRERHGETRDFFFAEERTCGEERASVFRSSDGGAEILHSRRFEDALCFPVPRRGGRRLYGGDQGRLPR